MSIDITKQYQTRDGRKVRLYADDGGPYHNYIHGATLNGDCWIHDTWSKDGDSFGERQGNGDLIPVPDWRDAIPWSAFAPWVRFVVRQPDERWFAKEHETNCLNGSWQQSQMGRTAIISSAIAMPAGPDDWREAIAERPEGK